MRQTRQAVRAINLSIFLRCLCCNHVIGVKLGDKTLNLAKLKLKLWISAERTSLLHYIIIYKFKKFSALAFEE
jgi:hypothetical protein